MSRAVLCLVTGFLGVSLVAQQAAPTAPPPVPTPLQTSWDDFLAGLRADAAAKGITAATIDAALTTLEMLPVAVERDRTQPEQVISLDEYLKRRLTKAVIARANAKAAEHAATLARIDATYGVPPAVVVAVWGIESNFGQFTGVRPTVQALATLAYDGRRALFRNELFDALRIVDQGSITLAELKGSWAGAMGQPQFMPSSYLRLAVDQDNDGRTDIWSTTADVFGSVANYLKHYGWTRGARWGREVALPATARTRIDHEVPMRRTGCRAEREMSEPRPLSTWAALGVTLPGGRPLPKAAISASLVRGDRRHFLAYENYGAFIAYNCANSYAVSLGLLADQIRTK